MHNYGATCILIGLGVKIDATTEGVGEVVILEGEVVFDVGGVVKSELEVQDEDDDNDEVDDEEEKGLKALSLSNGGTEEVEENDIVVGGVNVKGGGAGGWENVVTPTPAETEVDIEPHEFLLPFLLFCAGSFKIPDLIAALIAVWLLGIWLWVVLPLEVEADEEW